MIPLSFWFCVCFGVGHGSRFAAIMFYNVSRETIRGWNRDSSPEKKTVYALLYCIPLVRGWLGIPELHRC